MELTSTGRKTWLLKVTSHSSDSKSMRELIFVFAGSKPGDDSTRNFEGRVSQRFAQMPMELPSPTYQWRIQKVSYVFRKCQKYPYSNSFSFKEIIMITKTYHTIIIDITQIINSTLNPNLYFSILK